MAPPVAPGAPPSPAATKMPPRRTWWTFIAIMLVDFLVVSWLMRADDPLMVPYTAFKDEVAKGCGFQRLTHPVPGSECQQRFSRCAPKNLGGVQLLLGHSKLEWTGRYLGIEVDDTLQDSERTEM